jgi:hypothetical protein
LVGGSIHNTLASAKLRDEKEMEKLWLPLYELIEVFESKSLKLDKR